MSTFAELKRRNIFQVALLYAVVGWVLLQFIDLILEQLGVPGWVFRFIFALLVICFPLVLIFSWIYEITPEGLKRERLIEKDDSITSQTNRKLKRATLIAFTAGVLMLIANQFIDDAEAHNVDTLLQADQAGLRHQ